MKRNLFGIMLLSGISILPKANAQTTYEEMEQLTVNEQITTVITASEPVRFVDISTDKVAGDQPIDNIIRLKPKESGHEDGEILAIVTIVTERYRTQYALIYTTRMKEAVTDKEILLQERNAYNNPAVSMSTADMTHHARRIWNSPAKIRNVATKAHRMVMRLNNIYSVGDYFFIDFSIENKTNIRFDIDEIRIKLTDKKLAKATNAQTIELTPALVLESGKTFRHGYRNVIVVKKMTFPNDKLLTIEMTEKQISGRNISLNIDYEDILAAIIVIITCVCIAASANAQQGSGRLSLGTGLLYKNGMDITLAYEHEMNYRHMWEFFVNGYLQWAECASCGHICPESFWRNYRSYGFGVAYKPCMTRGRNHYGSLRIGASAGSDMNKFLGGLHFGYEHNYVLRAGWTLYWQVKSDVMIKGADVLRAGVVLGVKLPIK